MRGVYRSGLLLSSALTAIVAIGLSGVAFAAEQTYQFDIPAESLGQALTDFSRASSQQIVFSEEVTNGKRSPALHGRYSVSAALKTLLAGTDLVVDTSSNGVIGVRSKNVQAAQNEGAALAIGATPEIVIVTSEKRKEDIQDVPVPVTVIGTSQLTDTNQTQLKDYYTTVPGLVMQSAIVNQESISIRGINQGNAITVDDVPFGGSTGFSGNGYIPDFDPGDLDHIEVLKGPQGTLYGANSLGGLVKFVTKDPSFTDYSGRLEVGTSGVYNGSELGYSLRASANVPISDNFAVRVSAYDRQDPGYIDNPVYQLHGANEGQAAGGRLSALWQISNSLSLKLSASYEYYDLQSANDVVVGPGLGPLQQNYYPGIGGIRRWVQADSATLNYKLGDIDITSVTGFSDAVSRPTLDFTYAFEQGAEASYNTAPLVTPFLLRENTARLSEELRAAIPIGEKFDWLVGGFVSDETAPLSETINAETRATGQIVGVYSGYLQPTNFAEYAGFTDLTYHITPLLDLQVGGRETHTELNVGPGINSGPLNGPTTTIQAKTATPNDSFTYLVTPSFKVSPDLMVYARFASGFTPGGPNVVSYPTIPPNYGPEKTDDYELGLKGNFFDGMVAVDTAAYYVQFSGLVVNLKTGPSLFYSYSANVGAAKSEGVDLSVTARPLEGLSITVSGNYDNAVLTQSFPANSTTQGLSGDQLPQTARFSGYLSVNQDFPLWTNTTGFFGGDVSYIGDRLDTFVDVGQSRQAFPGYTKIDLHGGLRFDTWTLNFYINNLADRRGLIGGGSEYDPPNAFNYITPRTIGASIARRF